MNVLYLMPQPKHPDRLAAYSFLDEEVEGLARAGIVPFVLSVRSDAPSRIGAAHLVRVPPHDRVTERARTCAFLTTVAPLVPRANLLTLWRTYRPVHIERVAAEVVRACKIDLIHSHFGWPSGFGGMLARRATGIPLVASLRGSDVLIDPTIGYGRRGSEQEYDRTIRSLVRNIDRTICFSGFMRDYVVSLGVDAGRARVVRKGVDLSRFRPVADRAALKTRLGLPDAPMILSVGGLIPRKGVHVTLEALARLRATHAFTFAICGEGPEADRLRSLARDLGLQERVRFLGRVERAVMPDYFAACDFLVHAPSLEAAGNVLFEAMASGRPVVCTRAGGPEEYVEDGRTGYVVNADDVDALADRIRLLLDNADHRESLGAEALRQARTVFTFERMTRDIVAVYEEAREVAKERSVA